VTFIVYAALVGATFLLPVVLQVVSGYSPLASGLACCQRSSFSASGSR